MSKVRVGISGWTYADWKGGTFYPKGLSAKKELEYASRKLDSIEINGTFYSLQKPASFQNWHDQTPDDFIFSIKGGQYITHVRKLKNCEEALANFFASGLLCLGKKLGPLLWQLPPSLDFKDDRVEKFIDLLPRTTLEASKLAEEHTAKMNGKVFTEVLIEQPIHHAFEFRHPSYACSEILQMLKEKNVAWVFAHSGKEPAPYAEDLTADFVYIRLHGIDEKYLKGYPPKFLKEWKDRVIRWSMGGQPDDAKTIAIHSPEKIPRDVFVYFDNDGKEYAPKNALSFMKELGASKTEV